MIIKECERCHKVRRIQGKGYCHSCYCYLCSLKNKNGYLDRKNAYTKRLYSDKRYRDARNDNARFGGNRAKVLERDNYKCVLCGITQQEHKEKYGLDLNVNHKDHTGKGKKLHNNSMDNLETLCHSCHSKKHCAEYYEKNLFHRTKFMLAARGIYDL